MDTAGNPVFQLQLEQKRHDERAHRDIYSMPVPAALRHMTFHFAKYTGRLAKAQRQGDEGLLVRTVVDVFIIALSSANILNLDLSQTTRLAMGPMPDLPKLCQALAGDAALVERNPFNLALNELATATGMMAKACDALDHLEDFPVRATFRRAIEDIAWLALTISGLISFDMASLARDRWTQVEKVSIFYQATV